MVRCGVKANSSGNVVPLDSTSCMAQPAVAQDDVAEELFEDQESSIQPYLNSNFPSVIDNILVYIAGFVVRKVVKKLQCGICCDSLVDEYAPHTPGHLSSSYHFLRLKNRGGLVIPSEGTVRVVKEAERCIRAARSGKQAFFKCPVEIVDSYVRRAVGAADVFHLGQHIADTQHGIDNHHFQLMSSIVFFFIISGCTILQNCRMTSCRLEVAASPVSKTFCSWVSEYFLLVNSYYDHVLKVFAVCFMI